MNCEMSTSLSLSLSPHRPFKFMKLYQTAHSAKLGCLFLQRCHNLMGNVTAHSGCSDTHIINLRSHCRATCTPSMCPLWSSGAWGWMDGEPIIFLVLRVVQPRVCLLQVHTLNNKLGNKTFSKEPRKFELQSTRKSFIYWWAHGALRNMSVVGIPIAFLKT